MKLLVLVFLLFVALDVFAEGELRLIHINGVAEKTVAPNIAIVRVEIWAKSETAKVAQEQQAVRLSKVKESLEKFKIKNEDVQTESFNVFPEHSYDPKTHVSRIVAHRVNHVLKVTIRKVEDAGAIFDALIVNKDESNGVNVNNLMWDYDNKASVEAAALSDAVKNARTKADSLAKAAGVEIVAVHKIQHNSYETPPAMPMFERAEMKAVSDSVAPPTELSSGQIKIRVEVQMEFEI